jgi:hypothetical protein
MRIWGGFRRPAARMAFALGCAALVGCTSGSSGGAGKSPEEVVTLYLTSVKAGDYSTAYDLLTPHMVRDQGKIAWVAEQTAIMKIADVQIRSFEVFPAHIDGDEAIVPNLLKSTDKFINQGGANEYELYTLVRGQDGAWKIRLQQLVESDAVEAWFPERVRE